MKKPRRAALIRPLVLALVDLPSITAAPSSRVKQALHHIYGNSLVTQIL